MTYFCDICKKSYSSYKSKWLHNKKHHIIKNIIDNNINDDNIIK